MDSRNDFSGLHAELTEQIIGVFFSVANELGIGFMESVYKKSMMIGLRQAGIRAIEEVAIPVRFRGESAGIFYADIIVEERIILELKVAETVTRQAESQLTNYLRATRFEVGLALAFGERARFRRLVMTNDRKRSTSPILPT